MSGIEKIRAAADSGDWQEALRVAAKFPELGDHRDRIQKAWSANRNPDFYRELGRDPADLFADGVAALKERYGL